MPKFTNCPSHSGLDTWGCQACGKVFCSGCERSNWCTPVPGKTYNGNVCTRCLEFKLPRIMEAPMSLHEHCREESGGLEGQALERYINRYYGHG
jgi:hypothetical protein